MFSYRAFGLGIHSDLSLPAFVPAQVAADVVVRLEAAACLPPEACSADWHIHVTPDEAILSFAQVGVFLLYRGREVVVIPAPGADERLIQLYLAGTVMAIVLYQRGCLVLHASAVAVDGVVVAFMAQSGYGKSSLAAALHARGHQVVADDITAVYLSDSPALVIPAFPQLKLSPETATALGYDPDTMPMLHPLESKRAYRTEDAFASESLPLHCVYVLDEDTTPMVERISSGEAMIELVRHSYPTRMSQPGGTRHFMQCAQLARKITIWRLKRQQSLAALPDLARMVETHLNSIACTAEVEALQV